MNLTNHPQVPIPEQKKFHHKHECENCKQWIIFGILVYSDALEKTIFVCKDCPPPSFKQLPKKAEFREEHECVQCKKEKKVGVLTYCSRCEVGEFVCPSCLEQWFVKIASDEYGYEFKPPFE